MSDDSTASRFAELNQRFYAAEPSDYFHTRLLTLLVLADKTDSVMELVRQGVAHLGVTGTASADAEVDAESIAKYVAVESQVLLHHVAEAVLRLFVAHVDRPPCPWLVLASETSFARFKARVDNTVLAARRSGRLESEVVTVFLGQTETPDSVGVDEWERAVTNTTSFLRVLAERWLKQANVYNAMKHGLAVVPGDAIFQFLREDGTALRIGEGASVELLEATPWENGSRQWRVTTRWLDVKESLGLVAMACHMISSLWTVARSRYVGGPASGTFFFPADIKPADLRGQAGLHTFSLNVLVELREP